MRKDKIIIYNSQDGEAKLEVLLENETVWLSQKQMAVLFDCSADNVGLHLKNIFKENELSENSVTEHYSVTASDGKNYKVKHYNLDAIISVGYRINSSRGTQFRIWATQKLKEYIIKGFVMDDERLKQGGQQARFPNCFYRTSVKALVVDDKKRFLLVKEDNGTWDLPGGGLDFGEDAKSCLKKKIKEETGLEVTFISDNPVYFLTSQHRNGCWISNVIYKTKVKNLNFISSKECVAMKFFTAQEAKKENIFSNVKEFIKLYK
ncbi:MAG: RhuM family protein [Patescibacteria group bacterium]